MKKLIIASLVLLLAGISMIFYINQNIDKELENALESSSKNANFVVTKKEINKNLGSAIGYFEGKIAKEELENKLINYIEKFKEFGVTEEEIENIISLVKEEKPIKYDFDFRCDYEMKYSPFSVTNGVDIDGNITILTPEYAKVSNEIFKTKTPIKFNLNKTLSNSKFKANLADINIETDEDDIDFAGFEVSGTQTNDEKIKDFTIKFSDLALKNEFSLGLIKNFDMFVNFKNGIEKDFTKIFDDSFDSKVKIDKISIAGVDLTNLKTDASSVINDGRLNYKSSSSIEKLSGFDMEFKNFKYSDELLVDKKLYEFMNFTFSSLYVENADLALKKLKENFGNGFKYSLKDFSLENIDGNKTGINLNINMDKLGDTAEEIISNINYIGDFYIEPNFSGFLAPYGEVSFFGAMIDEYEGFKKDNNKLSIKLSNQNGEFLINDEKTDIKNPLLEMYFDAMEAENSQILTDDLEDYANYLDVLISDLYAFHTSQGKFSEDGINNMTNVNLVNTSKISAEFLVKNRRCIEINLEENAILFYKGDDSEDEICLEFYKIPSVEKILNTEKFEISEIIF